MANCTSNSSVCNAEDLVWLVGEEQNVMKLLKKINQKE